MADFVNVVLKLFGAFLVLVAVTIFEPLIQMLLIFVSIGLVFDLLIVYWFSQEALRDVSVFKKGRSATIEMDIVYVFILYLIVIVSQTTNPMAYMIVLTKAVSEAVSILGTKSYAISTENQIQSEDAG